MFSFHRPKVYRSSTGCCICKAKSSSSRFTDSKKYEEDFLECFKLSSPRQGEICNACVLLVKRWKKLPAGSDRNWRHVVDARAGPGMKSMTKFKSKIKKALDINNANEKLPKKKKQQHYEREYSPAPSEDRSEGNVDDAEMAEVDFLSEDGPSGGSSRTASPRESDCEDMVMVDKNRRHKSLPKRRDSFADVTDFIDEDYWQREIICCGTIYRGLYGEILSDPRSLRPCILKCKPEAKEPVKRETERADGVPGKNFSDSSSDSGYDESSNQDTTLTLSAATAAAPAKAYKREVSIEDSNSQIPKPN